MDFFSVKDFLATTLLRILKFGTKLARLTKKQPHIAYQSLYLLIFPLSNENFCRRFLGFYWSQYFVSCENTVLIYKFWSALLEGPSSRRASDLSAKGLSLPIPGTLYRYINNGPQNIINQ